jgi:hypothetical protein
VTGSPTTAIMREGQIAEYVNQLGPVLGKHFGKGHKTNSSGPVPPGVATTQAMSLATSLVVPAT